MDSFEKMVNEQELASILVGYWFEKLISTKVMIGISKFYGIKKWIC